MHPLVARTPARDDCAGRRRGASVEGPGCVRRDRLDVPRGCGRARHRNGTLPQLRERPAAPDRPEDARLHPLPRGRSAAPINVATLRLYVLRGGGRASVHAVAVKNWRERRITYGAAPALGRIVWTAPVPRRGRWASFDVTPVVNGAGMISVAISSTRGRSSSRAARVGRGRSPQLVVNGAGEPVGEDDDARRGRHRRLRLAGDEATARLLDAHPGTIAALGDIAYPEGRPQDFRCYDAPVGEF